MNNLIVLIFRFIPDDMEFDEEFKDICTELPNKDVYKPNQFLSTALSEAEVTRSCFIFKQISLSKMKYIL